VDARLHRHHRAAAIGAGDAGEWGTATSKTIIGDDENQPPNRVDFGVRALNLTGRGKKSSILLGSLGPIKIFRPKPNRTISTFSVRNLKESAIFPSNPALIDQCNIRKGPAISILQRFVPPTLSHIHKNILTVGSSIYFYTRKGGRAHEHMLTYHVVFGLFTSPIIADCHSPCSASEHRPPPPCSLPPLGSSLCHHFHVPWQHAGRNHALPSDDRRKLARWSGATLGST
jgi:hypothetical protein